MTAEPRGGVCGVGENEQSLGIGCRWLGVGGWWGVGGWLFVWGVASCVFFFLVKSVCVKPCPISTDNREVGQALNIQLQCHS